jgi:pSer/pThr/pTyr-binding forkhead associated (FHA) protein
MWILKGSPAADDGNSKNADVTFRVSAGAIKTVGRAGRADFILDVALVSRLHCRLEAGDDKIDVIDLSSTNGTYVNGKRVKRATLIAGDRLRVGRIELTIAKAKTADPSYSG